MAIIVLYQHFKDRSSRMQSENSFSAFAEAPPVMERSSMIAASFFAFADAKVGTNSMQTKFFAETVWMAKMLTECKLRATIQNLWMILADLWIKSPESLDDAPRTLSKPFNSLSEPIQKDTKKMDGTSRNPSIKS